MKIMIKSQLMRKRVGLRKGTAYENVVREIELMKRLDHPHVIKLIEVIDDPQEDKLFMILEFAEGGTTMRGEMEMEPLPEMISKKYFHDVVCGLEYLHSHQIIHRDIKPENLLVTAEGSVKISDLGVALQVVTKGDQKDLKKTVGSPIFLPPELCASESARVIGSALDIWSLGVTLYFFTFGVPPFNGDTEMQLYENIRTKKVTFPRKVDPALQDLLKKLLHKDPKHRITVREIKKHPWAQFEQLDRNDK
eukprot:TRINITY_DN3494_c0_g1_i1.p1 TRINITY_DN3494_c0_g1~~TRINITY_DN3494_c0_g1_i1.p1  ORF type:complete len:250 (-),score=79.61 TRINITY_DN3494_c0_g1_i1:223-972(-)